ncbi:MAG TPA: phage minor head protein [bacterium]|nr:phage minor head protein [bacterium]
MLAVALDQSERIKQAVASSFAARDLYTEKQVAALVVSLREAEKRIKADLLRYADLGSLTPGQSINQVRLAALNERIDDTIKALKVEHTLALKSAAKESHLEGITQGALELKVHGLPGYDSLTDESAKRLAKDAFSLMDRSALDFLVRFDVQLAGQVSSDLLTGVKNALTVGIAQGLSIPNIARNIGSVILDKEAFKQAGKTVFASAQQRIELIARTEILRAHNQGRLKFYDTVGVREVRWMVAADERLCPACSELDGQVFAIDKMPPIPRHPNCRCVPVSVPLRVCSTESLKLQAMAGPADAAGACLMSPQQVHDVAGAQKAEQAQTNKAIKQGDYESLALKPLQNECKKRGISIYRTKADFIKLLGQQNPGIDYSTWATKDIMAEVAKQSIGKTCTKDDLIALLKQWDAAHAAIIKEAAETLPDFASMTVKQLQDQCLKNGISIAKTKNHFIAELEKLEPNPAKPHFMLKGQELQAKIKQFGIGKLKTKDMLISDLQKALSIDKKTVQAVEEAVKHKTDLVKAIDAVVLPDDPAQYQAFLDSAKKAAQAYSQHADFLAATDVGPLSESLAQKISAWETQVKNMSLDDLKKLAQQTKLKHYQWHNKEELIARFSVFDESELAKIDASVETKWAKWAEKHGGKKAKTAPALKPKPAAEPQKPVSIPETALPPKDPTKLTPVDEPFRDVDAQWEKIKAKKPFKNRREVRSELGGAHRKFIYDDDQGNKWLFKPISEDFRAHGDEVAYRIGRLIDPDAVEVRLIELDGETGSIQRMVPKLKAQKDFKGIDPKDLLPAELEQVQREHVIDWLISNHDGHWENFLRGTDGHLYGIDKGQLYKFLGDDALDIAYHPNAVHGASEPYYNTVMRAFAEGKVDLDLQATLKYIERVEAIPDEQFLDILRPYAERRFKKGSAKLDAFYQMALDRKHSVRSDFEKFYGKLAKKRGLPGFSFDSKAAKKGAVRLGQFEQRMVEDAAEAGWQGKSIPIDVDQIEDQNALVFQQTVKKGSKVTGKQTIVQIKVRPEHEDKILEAIGKAGPPGKKAILPQVGAPLPEDEFYDTILTAVKSVNHHFADKNFNQKSVDAAINLKTKLSKLLKHEDAEIRHMAESYMAKIEELHASVLDVVNGKSSGKKVTKFIQYLRKSEPPKAVQAVKPKDMVVRKGKVLMQKRTNTAGEIITDGTERDLSSVFGRGMADGTQFEIEFEDGVSAVYRPWAGNSDIFAAAGELEVRVNGPCVPGIVEKALEKIERLGLNATPAAIEDAEIMYLQKQAYVQGIDNSPRYKKALGAMKNKSKQEQVKILRDFWNSELGVRDVTELPHYNPFGEFQHATRGKLGGAGRRTQMRFDLTESDLERQMSGYSLRHSLTDDRDMAEFIETALEHNGAMVSTVEKMRMGIKPGGMSPVADMESGGGTYFFTRIRKTPTAARPGEPGLYFKRNLLRRMDAITYDHDKFGRCTGDHVRRYRKSQIDQWKSIVQRNRSDETIFKYSVTLLDNLEVIVAPDRKAKMNIIMSFKKRGITHLPDGRKIEDIVWASY